MTALEAIVLTVRTWTADDDTLTRAREIGAALDGLVPAALAEPEPTAARAALRAAAVALDRLPQPLVVNMPGLAWTTYYEAQRRALHQRAVALFGLIEGQQVAPPLGHEPMPAGARSALSAYWWTR
jgi:hypothetical protein